MILIDALSNVLCANVGAMMKYIDRADITVTVMMINMDIMHEHFHEMHAHLAFFFPNFSSFLLLLYRSLLFELESDGLLDISESLTLFNKLALTMKSSVSLATVLPK